MTTDIEKEKLIEILKFTPRTYRVGLWGYGGEYVMGTVDRNIYDYFKKRKLSVSDFAWDSEYADEHDIPEEMWPFPPGYWYDCDDMGHTNGVQRGSGSLEITDENGDEVYRRSLDDTSDDDEPDWSYDGDCWIDDQPAGTVVFVGTSIEKGTFFDGELELTTPFDIKKLCLNVTEIDGNEIVTGVSYDGEEIEGSDGYSTNGKGSSFGFFVAGTNTGGKGYEKYEDTNDIQDDDLEEGTL